MRYLLPFLILGILSCNPKQKNIINSENPVETIKDQTPTNSKNESGWENVTFRELSEIGYYPVFLPSGNELIFSTSNYQGLWLYNIDNQKKSQLTNARGAGYRPEITDDQILYEVKSKKTTYEAYNLTRNKSTVISDLDGGSLKTYAKKGENQSVAIIASDLNSINIYKEGKKIKSISPQNYKNIVYASISPSGNKILIEVSGKGGYIVDLEGNVIHDLGKLDHPSWVTENEIVYAKIKDDGMKTTSGEIYIKNISLQKEYHISSGFSGMLENPKPNAKGNQIIANTLEGKLVLFSKK